MIQNGDSLPKFSAKDQSGNEMNSDQLKGSWSVIFFYPKDFTPGCTAEVCSFRDQYEEFTEAGATVVGVSSDSEGSHASFAGKFQVPFQLLSDQDRKLRKLFGVPKTLGFMDGRTTYVFSPEGKLVHRFNSQLGFTKHVGEALAVIKKGASQIA